VLVFFYMWVAGLLGGKVQAAYTIGLRLEMPLLGIAMTLGNACATLVGQNLGASDRARSWRAIWVSLGAEVSLLWPGAAALFFYRHELVALFAQDPEVMAIASEFLAYSAATLVVYAFYFISFRALQAAGEMNAPMVISFGNVVLLATPLSYYLAIETGLGAAGIWIGYLTYVVVNTAMTTAYLLSGRWARILRSRPAA
jgi:Na+-driven multidrug efflux pump